MITIFCSILGLSPNQSTDTFLRMAAIESLIEFVVVVWVMFPK